MENRPDTIKIGKNLIEINVASMNGRNKCDNPWQSKGTNIEPSELCAHTFTINLSSLP